MLLNIYQNQLHYYQPPSPFHPHPSGLVWPSPSVKATQLVMQTFIVCCNINMLKAKEFHILQENMLRICISTLGVTMIFMEGTSLISVYDFFH